MKARQILAAMSRTGVAAVAATALALVAKPGLHAQEPEEDAQQELIAELQQVNQELAGIRERAMQQDAGLRQEQAAAEEKVISAMKEIDPETERKLDRIQEVQGELRSAQQEGDQEKLGSLLQEQRQIQQALERAQTRALEEEEVAAAVEAFRVSLVAAMNEVDPKTDRLLQRQRELQAELMGPGG